MAYGKSRELQNAAREFNRQAQESKEGASVKGTRYQPPYFVGRFEPRLNIPDLVRLVPGDYLQEEVVGEGKNMQCIRKTRAFIRYTEHFDGFLEKGAICSAGPWANFKDKRQPCEGCDIYWETAQRNPNTGRIQSTRMSKQTKFAFNVFDFNLYHNVENIDKRTGQVSMNKKTGKAYMDWVPCKGQGCENCAAKKETKQGHLTHWPMSWSQFEVITTMARPISNSCMRCGGMNCIVSKAWACTSCGEPVIDQHTRLSQQDIDKITDFEYACRCGNKALLEEFIECAECTKRAQEGVRASIWDVNMQVMLIPKANSKEKLLQIMGWSNPGPVPAPFDVQCKPLDLVGRYAPMPIEKQKEMFGTGVKREPVTSDAAQPQVAGVGPQMYVNPYAQNKQ